MNTRNTFSLVILFICVCGIISGQTPVQKYGRLRTSGNKIVDKNQKVVRLAGMSFYWTNNGWGGDKFFTAGAVNSLVDDMKCNVLRIPMGVNEGGGIMEDSASNKKRVRTVVDACIAKGVYVIICFHSEEAHAFKKQSIAFFTEMAKKYGACDNVIYELNNEPGSVSWNKVVKPYANEVIDSIRKYDPDNMVIVGTTNWAKDVDTAAANKLADPNVAYAFHFFPGGNYTLGTYETRITSALDKGIAIVATEWGMSAETSLVDQWVSFMKKHDLSICNWSVNDNASEKYSLLKPGASTNGGWFDSNYSTSGLYVKGIIASYSADNITFADMASFIPSQTAYLVPVSYNAVGPRELHVELRDASNTLLGSGTAKVNAGTGTAAIEVTLDKAPAEAAGYAWRCDIREEGADFSQATDSKEYANVSVVTSVKIILLQTMSIVEGAEAGKSFDVLLLNSTFANPLVASHWTLSYLPAGVIVDTVLRVTDTRATVVLRGNASAGSYTSNISNLTVVVAKEGLSSAKSDVIASTGIVLSKAYSYMPATYTDGSYKRLNYGFFTPENYDKNKKYPLVMYLHGFGNTRPVYLAFYDAKVQNANPCFVYTPRTEAYSNANGEWFDTWSNWWSTLTGQMTSALEQMGTLAKKYPIDTNRIYVYGISMGGEGVFDLLDKRPNTFAAAISICGGGRDWWAPNIAKTPFWMFHGGKDNINTPDLTEKVYDKLDSMGAKKMRYTNYPDMGHEIWNTAQNEPSFLDWMFAFSKADTLYPKPTKPITLNAIRNGNELLLSWNDVRETSNLANKVWYYNIYNGKGKIATTEFDKTSYTVSSIGQTDSLWVEAVNYTFQKSAPSNKIVFDSSKTSASTLVAGKSVRITQFGDRIDVSADAMGLPIEVEVFTVDGKKLCSKRNSKPHVSINTQAIDSSVVILKVYFDNSVVSRKLFIR